MLLLGLWNGTTKETRDEGEEKQATYGIRTSPLALQVPAQASN